MLKGNIYPVHKADYDTEYTQYLYVTNMNHPELLVEKVDKDHTSTDTERQKGYKEGSFIGTIACHANWVLGICSTFHISTPYSTTSRPLPGGRNDLQNQERQPRLCHSFRS